MDSAEVKFVELVKSHPELWENKNYELPLLKNIAGWHDVGMNLYPPISGYHAWSKFKDLAYQFDVLHCFSLDEAAKGRNFVPTWALYEKLKFLKPIVPEAEQCHDEQRRLEHERELARRATNRKLRQDKLLREYQKAQRAVHNYEVEEDSLSSDSENSTSEDDTTLSESEGEERMIMKAKIAALRK